MEEVYIHNPCKETMNATGRDSCSTSPPHRPSFLAHIRFPRLYNKMSSPAYKMTATAATPAAPTTVHALALRTDAAFLRKLKF